MLSYPTSSLLNVLTVVPYNIPGYQISTYHPLWVLIASWPASGQSILKIPYESQLAGTLSASNCFGLGPLETALRWRFMGSGLLVSAPRVNTGKGAKEVVLIE